MNERRETRLSLRKASARPARALAAFWPKANDGLDGILVRDIEDDSRDIRPGDAWLCLPGAGARKAEFMRQAADAGAVLCLHVGRCELPEPSLPVCELTDMEAAGLLLRRWFASESARTRCVGITGTDGKTSVAWFTRLALREAGGAWSAGTLGWIDEQGRSMNLGNTTAGLLDNHRLLAAAESAGIAFLVLEVSSHGIDQRRIAGIPFSCVAWTTMGLDHLDYHANADSYLACKANFVRSMARSGATIVANIEQPAITQALRGIDAVRWYGPMGSSARIRWQTPALGRLHISTPDSEWEMREVPVGTIHAQNMTAAAACLDALGIATQRAARAWSGASAPPGRMQAVPDARGRVVVVDYAHTAEALSCALRSLRDTCDRRLLLLFGCGGDRDREKRPRMGQVAAQWADEIWLTSDNPRNEEPEAIIADIRHGMPGDARIHCQADRARAIAEAIAHMRPGECLLIAGKGHEEYMETKDGRRQPWSDVAWARRCLEQTPC